MIYIHPYKIGSKSSFSLAQQMAITRITGLKRLIHRNTVIINWGNTSGNIVSKYDTKIINNYDNVFCAANKLIAFQTLTKAGLPTVPFTTNKEYAKTWLTSGATVMARTLLQSSQGRGITVTKPNEELISCPLYTKYIPKCKEYRVHVAFNSVIDFSKKKRRIEGTINDYIKNHNNGWVFCRENEVLPNKVSDVCVKAVSALGLDFGAVDVLYKELTGDIYILEINTAPGIEGTTLQKYVETFRRFA